MVFFSYVVAGELRNRVILDTVNERWRNDTQQAVSILLEADTNTILYGD